MVTPAENGGAACPELEETRACNEGLTCLCLDLPDQTTCDGQTGCAWDADAGLCDDRPACANLLTDADCLIDGDPYSCIWIGTECITDDCYAMFDQASCDDSSTSNWNGTICEEDLTPPTTCADIGPDRPRCEASPLGCSFDAATQTFQTAPGLTTSCRAAATRSACDAFPGCLWFLDSECITQPDPPCVAPDQASCEFAGACDWDGSSCVADPDPPASCPELSDDPDRCAASQLDCVYDVADGVCRDAGSPLDCAVSDVGDWSTCSLPCDGGEQTRTRTVLQEPLNGGADCPELEETRACNTRVPCACSELTTEVQCDQVTTPDCSWDGSRCIDPAASNTCDAQVGEAACLSFSDDRCIWLAPLARCLSDSCSSSTTQGDCEALARCDWDGSTCADAAPPATCADLTSDPDRCDAASIGGPDYAFDLSTSTCVDETAPRDCVVDDWMAWYDSSLPCDGGQQTRTRAVLQDPANGGTACGQTEETQPCNTCVTCVCTDLVNQTTCEAVPDPDCAWDGSTCALASPAPCDTLDQATCEGATGQNLGCAWVGSLFECIDANP